MKKLTVNASIFLEWFYDYDMVKDMGFDIVKALKKTGKYELTAESVFANCEYIPVSLINELKGNQELEDKLMEEFEEEEIFFYPNINSFEIDGEKYEVEIVDIGELEEKDKESVKIKAVFEYADGDITFTMIGLVEKEQYEEAKEYGLGYVNDSDMMTDAMGFNMHTVLEGEEDWDAYIRVNSDINNTGNVQCEIIN